MITGHNQIYRWRRRVRPLRRSFPEPLFGSGFTSVSNAFLRVQSAPAGNRDGVSEGARGSNKLCDARGQALQCRNPDRLDATESCLVGPLLRTDLY